MNHLAAIRRLYTCNASDLHLVGNEPATCANWKRRRTAAFPQALH
jgi:hypothetical protein